MLLRAGPIRLKFADGELRYLCVGNREIARRVLFVVRDHHWDTAMPEFSKIVVEQREDSFEIELEAKCKIPTVDFAWEGRITGAANGVITFAASGQPLSDFGSNRIGICLLFGAESLAGHPFEIADAGGKVRPGQFSSHVSPVLLAENFRELKYAIDEGLKVSASVEGTLFSMEDQRNYADSSYKAYAPLKYDYPSAPAGAKREQVFRLAVEGAEAHPAPVLSPSHEPAVSRIRLGGVIKGAKVPKVSRSHESTHEANFYSVNTQRHLHATASAVQFACNPGLHMPDDDTFMENVGAVCDQVETARAFAPGALIRIDPVTFNSQHPRPGADPRNESQFGAAWSAAILKYLSLAGVDEAGFRIHGTSARAIQEEIGAHEGAEVFEAVTEAPVRPPVEAFAIKGKSGAKIWLINMTDVRQRVEVIDEKETAAIPVADLEPYAVLAVDLQLPET